MATYDSIRENINELEELLQRATTISKCLNNADTGVDEDVSAWVGLFTTTVKGISDAGQKVIEDMNLRAIPLMKDMAKVTASRRDPG